MNATYLGIDIAKDVFQLCGMSQGGAVVLSKRLRRKQLLTFIANVSPCTIGIEACSGAYYWHRQFEQLGHTVKIISPPVWRRILLSSDTTIAELHTVIQASMGWEDIHLNLFTIRGQRYGVPRAGGICFHAGSGDLPRCIGGRGACPPEEFGPPEHFMDTKDGHSIFDLIDWLSDSLQKNVSMAEVREELAVRMPWADRWFDRKAVNGPLNALDCYIAGPTLR